MPLISRRRSKKQQLARAAGKTAKKAAKAKAVQKAPKTAAAIWAGKRSGKIVRGALVVGAVAMAMKLLRRRGGDDGGDVFEPEPAPTSVNGVGESYRTTPTPVSSQQTEGGAASGPDPGGPTATEQAKDEVKDEATSPPESGSATPPHGDPLAEDADREA